MAADLLVVGLGNPGSKYEGTRHNVGADVVALLSSRHGGRLKTSKDRALTDAVRIGQHQVALAFPTTFMNESGQAVRPLVKHYGIDDLEKLVVVHDELDLEPGRLKLKFGGGLAGHNGLRSIKAHLGTADFTRVRIGVGKPASASAGAGHVLKKLTKAAKIEQDISVQEAADAIEQILTNGLEATMNQVNGRAS